MLSYLFKLLFGASFSMLFNHFRTSMSSLLYHIFSTGYSTYFRCHKNMVSELRFLSFSMHKVK